MIAAHRQAFVVRSTTADIDRCYLNLLVFSTAFTLRYFSKTEGCMLINNTIDYGNSAVDIAGSSSAERAGSRTGKASRAATGAYEKRDRHSR